MKKLAVVFPGIGYHTDKPLLYYSKKMAARYGFEIREAAYGGFPADVKGSKEKMMQAFQSALAQSEDLLRDVEFQAYDGILFLSKSIGTAVASAYGQKKGLTTANVYYTPVEESLDYMTQPGIVFHGTKDPWADTEVLKTRCGEKGYKVHLIENANHSLETGEVKKDLENLAYIMAVTEDYIGGTESFFKGQQS